MGENGALSAFFMYKSRNLNKKKIQKNKHDKLSSRINKRKIVKKRNSSKQVLTTDTSCNSKTVKIFTNSDVVSNNNKDDPCKDALQLFEWLIGPIGADQFFKTYWEQKVLYIKRSNKCYYEEIFSSESLDKILRNNNLYYGQNIDVVCYENGEKKVYNQEGKAIPSAVWDYYLNGCSVRVLNPQTYCQKVHLLETTLQEYFGSMVGANVYLTPPGSQGFAPHFDDIEAFVIQLEGRKHWKLYKPKSSDILARYSSPNLKHSDIGDPFMNITLNAGEMLYFPRGTIHEGYTDKNSHSLHITLSVYQHTSYVDLLEHILPEALKKAAENNVEFRRGLPINYLKGAGVCSTVKNSSLKLRVNDLIMSLINYANIDAAVDQLGRKFMYDSMPPSLSNDEAKRSSKSDGPYLKNGVVINQVEITLETRIRLLRYYCVRLVDEPHSSPKLYYNTENANVYHGREEQWLELERDMIPCIQKLQHTYPSYIKVEELPMNDDMSKMQLVSDLWEHGILISEHPLEMKT